jgi:UDP-glucose 4-epimerase
MAKILITGGTGSFGNALVRRFLNDKKFSEIVIFSRDEKKQYDMQNLFPYKKITYIIGDIRFKDSIAGACRGVDYIFHAAALKHVPVGEYFPMEFVRTNILGTNNVLEAAEENGVKKVVLLSSDKASYPVNTMGICKALAEKLIIGHARISKSTVFCSVRYGNVMASRGSVIPLFVELIKAGKPLPITDPKMTRFLISLDDAIGLVELAILKGKQGDLFIKKAPATTMEDLTQALLNVFEAKNKIKIVGVRPGEKIHETMITSLEFARAKDLGKHYCIFAEDMSSRDYEKFYNKNIDLPDYEYTSENAKRLTIPEIEKLLLSLPYIQDELKIFKKSVK